MVTVRHVMAALLLYVQKPDTYWNCGTPAGKLLRSRPSRDGFGSAPDFGLLLVWGTTSFFSTRLSLVFTADKRDLTSRVPFPRLEKSSHSKDGHQDAWDSWRLRWFRVLEQYLCDSPIRCSKAKNSSKLSPSLLVQDRFGMGLR